MFALPKNKYYYLFKYVSQIRVLVTTVINVRVNIPFYITYSVMDKALHLVY